jgi:2-haloacid dehalogenase
MPIPKNVTFVTFDVYGTLIDWESGIYDAFAKEAARDGVEIDRAVLLSMFHEISREIEGGSYELYAEVLDALQGNGAAATEAVQEVPAGAVVEHR